MRGSCGIGGLLRNEASKTHPANQYVARNNRLSFVEWPRPFSAPTGLVSESGRAAFYEGRGYALGPTPVVFGEK